MKLEGMHLFFKKIAEFQLKYRWLCLALLAAVTVVGLIGVKSFKVGSADEDEFLTVKESTKKNDARFKELFGSNDSIVLLFESDDVFKPEVLQAIKDIGTDLLEKVPYADSITSITDTDITVGTDEGIEITNPFRDGIPSDPADLQKAKDFILSRKSIVNKLVTQDATETWLVLSLKATPPEEVWSKTSTKAPMYVIGEAAIDIVTDPKYHSAAYTIKPAGLPYTETEKSRDGTRDHKKRGLEFSLYDYLAHHIYPLAARNDRTAIRNLLRYYYGARLYGLFAYFGKVGDDVGSDCACDGAFGRLLDSPRQFI